jgi:Kef-type K+ transport system membrane component KefB
VTEHQLFLFLAEVVVLFAAARLGGEVAARLGIPLHVGELVFGMLLGPSFLGWLWPGAFETLFPPDPLQRSLLDIMAWIGIVFLVLIAGLETRLGLLRGARRAVVGGWVGGFILPFLAGFALGMLFPDELVPTSVDRTVFALFLATAISISAIPVIARILMDLDLYRTRMGMVILSTAVAGDTAGWIVLAVVAGLAAEGLEAASVLRTILMTGGFIAVAFTVGPTLVRKALRLSSHLKIPYAQLSMMLLLVLGSAAITQAIGVHLVLGAFVAAILIGRVGRFRRMDPDAITGVQQVGMGFFVPFFFAYTGIKVDLTTMDPDALLFTAIAVVVAVASKVIGGALGARWGRLPRWEALAVGFGLNARGAMELVIAAIGLSLGIVTEAVYAMIVLIAVLTTVMAAPLLKACVVRAGPEAGLPQPDATNVDASPPVGARISTEGGSDDGSRA